MADLDAALTALRNAVQDEGRVPEYHRLIMARHREEWPALWVAIDRLLSLAPEANDG